MALNTLQGYNSNSPRRTGLQRVLARPKHLYTRRPLSLPRTVPLYTFAAATYHGAPHLRRRNSPRSCFGRVGFFESSRLDRLHPRAEAHPTCGASCSSIPSVPKVIHPHFRHRRPAPFSWVVPAQQNSHNSSSISVFIKSPLQNFLRRSEAVRGPKPTAQPDVAKCSRRPFSPTALGGLHPHCVGCPYCHQLHHSTLQGSGVRGAGSTLLPSMSHHATSPEPPRVG
jgi:hypothetical protein